MKQPQKIFISYCRRDREWMERLKVHLAPYAERIQVTPWADNEIEPGQQWCVEIQKAVAGARAAVLLVSPDFLASEFIMKQEVPLLMEAARQGRLVILWFLLHPSSFAQTPVAAFQALADPNRSLASLPSVEQDAALVAICRKLERVLLKPAPPLSDDIDRPDSTRKTAAEVFLSQIPVPGSAFVGRDSELRLLDQAWSDPGTHVLVLTAWGGVGKTSLVYHWLDRIEPEHYRGAKRVYGWSFHSQGAQEEPEASADGFFAHALRWFGDTEPSPAEPRDKGWRLATLIRKQQTLLILDGVEPLLYPSGALCGRLKDEGLLSLLKELARGQSGLCVVTTRIGLRDLEDLHRPTVKSVLLENLPLATAVALLQQLGVHGSAADLEQTSREFGGHALALTLLGRYLSVVHAGDVRRRDRVSLADDIPEDAGRQVRRLMRSYEQWLQGTPELAILRLLALFDRPAQSEAIQVLRQPPAIPQLTDALSGLSEAGWKFALEHLHEMRLLDGGEGPDIGLLSCHPLIREHFASALRARHPEAWKQAHSRLYDYFRQQPRQHRPDTLEDMEPLFRAITHGCQAGRHAAACSEVYWERIQRGNEYYCTNILGAFGANLAALASFFASPWTRVAPELGHEAQALILNWAGFSLWALGRLGEAEELTTSAMERALAGKAWADAGANAANLSGLCLTLGRVTQAVEYGQRSLELATRTGAPLLRKSTLALCWLRPCTRGVMSPPARALFDQAEARRTSSA